MTPPHLVVIGAAFAGNKGAAAMLETVIRGMRERHPGCRFTLLSMYPDEDNALNDDPGVDIVPATPLRLGVVINLLALVYRILPPARGLLRRRSRAVRSLVDGDALVDLGGITFSDGREKFLLYNVASILPALFVGTPVFKCAQAVGPFRTTINRTTSRIFLPRVHTIVTRGRITHGHAVELGLDNLLAGADLALALEELSSGAALPELPDDQSVVGLAPSAVMHRKVTAAGGDYVGQMADLVDHLARDHHVLLVPHSARPGTDKTHNNDLPVCRQIVERTGANDRLHFLDGDYAAGDLRAVIGRCDVFITSRFHGMVSALATSTPTLVLGWSHKYREVLEMFGAEDWAIDGATASTAEVTARFDELWAERAAVAARLQTALPDVRARAVEQLDALSVLVASGA